MNCGRPLSLGLIEGTLDKLVYVINYTPKNCIVTKHKSIFLNLRFGEYYFIGLVQKILQKSPKSYAY